MDNIHNIKTMTNKELMRYFEALKFTNKHLKEMFIKKPENFKSTDGVDWLLALRRRNEVLQDVRDEIVRRMETASNDAKE